MRPNSRNAFLLHIKATINNMEDAGNVLARAADMSLLRMVHDALLSLWRSRISWFPIGQLLHLQTKAPGPCLWGYIYSLWHATSGE